MSYLAVAKAKAVKEKRKREEAGLRQNRFEKYRYDFDGYCREVMEVELWSMQAEIGAAYIKALRQQHEKMAFEKGELPLDDLDHWRPGEVIRNWIAVDAGHTVGKTFLLAKLVSHFFDCFTPSIVYCFAPSGEQIDDLLFKEIRTDRQGRDLPGRVLDGKPRINYKGNHFVRGKATDNANNTGAERTHGQHGKYLMFVIDEAEGVPDYVWKAIRSMTSGGISIVISARNPRTTICQAHKIRSQSNTRKFRISCLDHPNVIQGKEVVPDSVMRQYVMTMAEGQCDTVNRHDPDKYTFEIPWQPGIIYQPHPEFLWRVMGIATSQLAGNTFCPPGRYESAMTRPPHPSDDPKVARLGLDVARYGDDQGTLYVRHAGRAWREEQFSRKNTNTYARRIKDLCCRLVSKGVEDIQVRIDAGGGFGGGVADKLEEDGEIQQGLDLTNRLAPLTDDDKDHPFYGLREFSVIEVHNGATPYDPHSFYNLGTEMYYHGGEALKAIQLDSPPAALEIDLCERPYEYRKLKGVDVKILEDKEKFRKRFSRSPDDGDGFVLAVAPDHLFRSNEVQLGWV